MKSVPQQKMKIEIEILMRLSTNERTLLKKVHVNVISGGQKIINPDLKLYKSISVELTVGNRCIFHCNNLFVSPKFRKKTLLSSQAMGT